jgi:hypothetical protein
LSLASEIAKKSKAGIKLITRIELTRMCFFAPPNAYLTPVIETGIQVEYIE